MNGLLFLTVTSLGICALIAFYTHLAGFSRRALLSDEQAARDLLTKLAPGKSIAHLYLAGDRHTALAIFADGSGSLLHAMGHKWVTHTLSENTIRSVRMNGQHRLHLAFADYTAPSLDISLNGEDTGKAWDAALRPFMEGSTALTGQAS